MTRARRPAAVSVCTTTRTRRQARSLPKTAEGVVTRPSSRAKPFGFCLATVSPITSTPATRLTLSFRRAVRPCRCFATASRSTRCS